MFCYHRWKLVQEKRTVSLEREVRKETPWLSWKGDEFPDILKNRVCEKCHYEDNQIDRARLRMKIVAAMQKPEPEEVGAKNFFKNFLDLFLVFLGRR